MAVASGRSVFRSQGEAATGPPWPVQAWSSSALSPSVVFALIGPRPVVPALAGSLGALGSFPALARPVRRGDVERRNDSNGVGSRWVEHD